MKYPTVLNNLIECFKKLPSIGEKSAERLALSTLTMDEEFLEMFSTSLIDVKKKIKKCQICNHLADGDLCEICKHAETRDQNTLCIVEEPKNIILFERVGTYHGMYHVLGGLISPIDGINPKDININSLIERIKNGNFKEVIIAVKPSIEGETTTLYISKLLEGLPVKVTKIAHGVPLGVEMEYLDALTLEMALEDRKDVS